MPDYQGNSKKAKEEQQQVPSKNVEKVVVGEVVVQKKTLGRKFRDIFVGADIKSVAHYVVSDVLIPAARNMIVDASTKGIERMMYGESTHRRHYGPGPRVTYNNPINRGYRGELPPRGRHAPPPAPGPRSARYSRDEFIITSRDEAELVLERLNDIIDQYDVASVADLNELVGFATSHVDNKWGWTDLRGTQIRQVREGYLIDLPEAEPI